MKRKLIRPIIFICIIIFAISLAYVFYSGYFIDKYEAIKPLPAEIPIKMRTDSYGEGYFGAPRGSYKHRGIDILADVGTHVLACKLGRVIKVSYDELSGNYIVIQHRGDLVSYYLHLKDIYVKEKQRVKQGQIIATVGKSGNARYKSMKPHLHFEIRKDGVAQDVLNIYELKSLTD